MLAASPFLLADEIESSDASSQNYQKTGRPPMPPPPQTSNSVFYRTQQATFENQSPRNCGDGRVALKGETCDSIAPQPENQGESEKSPSP